MYSTIDKGKTCKRRACFLRIICFFRNYTIVLDELKNFCNTTKLHVQPHPVAVALLDDLLALLVHFGEDERRNMVASTFALLPYTLSASIHPSLIQRETLASVTC